MNGEPASDLFELAGQPAAAYQSALNGLRYEYDDDLVRCNVCLDQRFSSHAGRIHGGLVATLFDEAMGHAAYHRSGVAMVTTLLRVRFVEAMRPGLTHRLDVRIGTEIGGVLDVAAELSGETLVAAAMAKFRPLS